MEVIAWVATGLGILNTFLLVLVFREIGILRIAAPGRRAGLGLDVPLPDFHLPTLDGSFVSSTDARRRVMLFVSGECDACRHLVDKLRAMPRTDLPPLLVGVTSRTDIDRGTPFLRTLDFLDPKTVFLDDRRVLFNELKIPVTPWAYVISDSTKIRGSGIPADVEELADLARVVA